MRPDLSGLSWPHDRIVEGLEALARRGGLAASRGELPSAIPRGLSDEPEAFDRWLDTAAAQLGLEVEPVEVSYAEVGAMLAGAGPAIVRVPGREGEAQRYLLLLRGGPRQVMLLGPDLLVRRVPSHEVMRALCHKLEGRVGPDVDQLLEQAGVPLRRRPRARTALLRDRLGATRLGGCWMLRLPPGASFWRQVLNARLSGRVLAFLGAHVLQYLLMLISWWMVGRGALEGRLDRQLLIAWALLLITQVPLQLIASWMQGLFAIGLGGLLKLRLLHGALRLEPEEIRHQGAGQLLGRVVEAGAVEALALSAGFSGLMAIIEVLLGIGVLLLGPWGGLRALLFLCWIGVTVLLAGRYYRLRRGWTDCRLQLTNDLVERMVGHRTRLAQDAPERCHEEEDQALEYYAEWSRAMDAASLQFNVLVWRGWMVLGIVGLVPLVLSSEGTPAALALGLGGILLAARALSTLTETLAAVTGAAIAWRQVGPLYRASARPELAGSPGLVALSGGERTAARQGQALIDANEVVFRHAGRTEPVLRGCSLRLGVGERVLLEGPSGGGKSTLAALLAGLRAPASGLVLLGGLDRQTLGSAGWRRRVASAPQFHENHVFTGTLAFNLLMGRRWPPRAKDLQEAESLCRELGLGELLDRMPAGMQQTVGETGWQLSHGERSRLYIARALLQGAELVVLDESFAALDPANLHLALRCVLKRAPTLLVIAHP